MTHRLVITINGKKAHASAGSSIASLLHKNPHKGRFPAIAALVNNRLVGLYHDLKTTSKITTIDFTSREGTEVYRRTANLIFFAALKEAAPKATVEVGQSIGNGYFLEINNAKISDKLIIAIEARMRKIAKDNFTLRPVWIPIEDAV